MTRKGTETTRFTEAFYRVLARDPHTAPGPTAINLELGKKRTDRTPLNTLNGRMAALRRDLLLLNGFSQENKWGRWVRTGPVILSYPLGKACSCCAVLLANGDTSGCENNCIEPDDTTERHVDRLCQFGLEPDEHAVPGEVLESPDMFRCVGCGDDVYDYGCEVAVLYPSRSKEDVR